MATNELQQETSPSLSRLLGMLYIMVGAVGLMALLFLSGQRGFEELSEPFAIIAMTVLLLVLIIIGLIMAVRKRGIETT